MNQLAAWLSRRVCDKLDYDQEKYEVINYGMIALVQLGVFIVCIGILGALCGTLLGPYLILFTVALLRKYSGGIHAKSLEQCTVIGVISCVLMGKISQWISGTFLLNQIVIWGILVYLIALILIITLAPVDSVNKPITSKDKKARMRRYSVIVIVDTFILCLCFIVLGQTAAAVAVCMGICWQSLTLVPAGLAKLTKGGSTSEKIK